MSALSQSFVTLYNSKLWEYKLQNPLYLVPAVVVTKHDERREQEGTLHLGYSKRFDKPVL